MDTLEDVSGGLQLETVYLSPFTGPCPALQFAPETSVARWSEALKVLMSRDGVLLPARFGPLSLRAP